MDTDEIKNLAKRYLSRDLDAFDEFLDLTLDDPEKAWPIVLEMFHQATDEKSLAFVAAGPLEDIICEHPTIVIDRVLDLAKKDPRFRKCLKGVWGWSQMPAQIRKRIEEAVVDEPDW